MSQAPADRAHCPLCGKPNGCAMEAPQVPGQQNAPCWCTQVEFSPALLQRLPAQARGQACICRDCAQRDADS